MSRNKLYLCTKVVLFTASMPTFVNAANKTCFCDAVHVSPNQNTTTLVGLTQDANLSFNTIIVTPSMKGDCKARCKVVFENRRATDITTAACSIPGLNGPDVRALSWVSKKQNLTDAGYYAIERKLGQFCPPTWLSNDTNQPGGVTFDGMCKKEFLIQGLIPLMTAPVTPPQDGTPIGNWGFYWGGALVARGTTNNGGAAGAPTPAAGQKCSVIPK